MAGRLRTQDCVHHWMIDFPTTRTSAGRCIHCDASREFLNAPPDLEPNPQVSGAPWDSFGRQSAERGRARPSP